MFSECVRPPGFGSGGGIAAPNHPDANYKTVGSPSACLAAYAGNKWANAANISLRARSMGSRAYQGYQNMIAFNTILPPSRGVCNADGLGGDGVLPPRSKHPGRVVGAFADGAVKFISDNIDYGDLTGTISSPTGNSPYGVWAALGSRQRGEILRLDP